MAAPSSYSLSAVCPLNAVGRQQHFALRRPAAINLSLEDHGIFLCASSRHLSTCHRLSDPVRPDYQSFLTIYIIAICHLRITPKCRWVSLDTERFSCQVLLRCPLQMTYKYFYVLYLVVHFLSYYQFLE